MEEETALFSYWPSTNSTRVWPFWPTHPALWVCLPILTQVPVWTSTSGGQSQYLMNGIWPIPTGLSTLCPSLNWVS